MKIYIIDELYKILLTKNNVILSFLVILISILFFSFFFVFDNRSINSKESFTRSLKEIL